MARRFSGRNRIGNNHFSYLAVYHNSKCPFWYLLQASHHEKIAAIAIWAHTISVLLLLPLVFIGINISLDQLLIYWTITALLTQVLIYFFVESKLSMFWIIFKNRRLIGSFCCQLVVIYCNLSCWFSDII